MEALRAQAAELAGELALRQESALALADQLAAVERRHAEAVAAIPCVRTTPAMPPAAPPSHKTSRNTSRGTFAHALHCLQA